MNRKPNLIALSIAVVVSPLSVACSATPDAETEQIASADQAITGPGPGFDVAYQTAGHLLAELGHPAVATIMPGTSPSIMPLSGGGADIAFQDVHQSYLWLSTPSQFQNTYLGMDAASSPSIAAMPGGGYQMAFQANTHVLWVTGKTGTGPLYLPMMPGTSPAIAALGSTWEVAFQHSNGHLWFAGNTGTFDSGYPMAPNTSPALIALNPSYNGFEAAFRHSNGNLWIYGTESCKDTGYGMAPNTSPSIAKIPADQYGIERFRIAFHANNDYDHLWVTGESGGIVSDAFDTGYGLAPNTSPSIAVSRTTHSTWEVAFQSYGTNRLWFYGTQATGDTGNPMAPFTNPSITAL